MIEDLWAAGESIKQIREITGIRGFAAGSYRHHGYDLPYRTEADKKRADAWKGKRRKEGKG